MTAPCAPPGFRSESRTHVGRVRAINEDRLLDRPDRGLWAVSDGMGGHHAGSAAASTVVEALARLADRDVAIDGSKVCDALAQANSAICTGRHKDAPVSGATVVAAVMNGMTATICWAGDSRAYRIRNGQPEQLTRDHSVVQEMVDAGALTAAAAERHPRANLITRALGIAPTVVIEQVTTQVRPGDYLLLCSDGISRSLDSRDFAIMPAAIDAIADRFLVNALQRDGSDNATLILITPER